MAGLAEIKLPLEGTKSSLRNHAPIGSVFFPQRAHTRTNSATPPPRNQSSQETQIRAPKNKY